MSAAVDGQAMIAHAAVIRSAITATKLQAQTIPAAA